MSENNKVLVFVVIMCVVVAGSLTALRQATADIAKANETLFNRQAMLSSLGDNLIVDGAPVEDTQDLSQEQVDAIFADTKALQQVVLNAEGGVVEGKLADEVKMDKEDKKDEAEKQYPLYIYTNAKGKKFYIVAAYGKGLWDKIWGSIALEDDMQTIAGVSYDHKGETPGLGAEIKDSQDWKNKFVGKKMYNDDGDVALNVTKVVKNKNYDVDGISGATITGNGVTEMIQRCIQVYKPYFDTQKK